MTLAPEDVLAFSLLFHHNSVNLGVVSTSPDARARENDAVAAFPDASTSSAARISSSLGAGLAPGRAPSSGQGGS